MSLKQLLTERREEILARFVRVAEQKMLPPRALPRLVLLDHIPVFLDEIVNYLFQDGGRADLGAVDLDSSARQHGVQRWKAGYDLEAVVREYGVLRRAILDVAKSAQISLSIDEYDALADYLNGGVAAATAEYVRSRDEQLRTRQEDLEFLAEAGELLGST